MRYRRGAPYGSASGGRNCSLRVCEEVGDLVYNGMCVAFIMEARQALKAD